MADNDLIVRDNSSEEGTTFRPRVKDRGSDVRETVVGISNVSGTQVDPASKQDIHEVTLATLAVEEGLGDDGVSPPALLGTGIRGWLRAIFEKLATGTLSVAGSAPAGSAPAKPPLSVSGVDPGGFKRHLATDVAGRITNVELPVQGVIDMPIPGTTYTAGRAVEVVAITAGLVTLTYADASTRTRSFAVGLTRLPDAVTAWARPSGSSFTGTLCNLK